MGGVQILLDDLSVTDPYGALGMKRGMEAVGRHDNGGAITLVKFFEKGQNGITGIVVERACRFIGQNQTGAMNDRPDDGHALLFSTGKLGGKSVLFSEKPNFPKKGESLLSGLFFFKMKKPCRKENIFKNGKGGEEVEKLEDKPHMFPSKQGLFLLAFGDDRFSADFDFSAIGGVNSCQKI